ncbi:hypothetical protein FN846DRAFT_222377 [Sphaerosporella brunnea]|uniref:Secreted protein n=1 Tax=Sphaerosporella brunnea TaxID=1250544 RepID=A0A5J5F7H7_9PEZI|nr:hypothetical protein FN846DRAFT_222377 [Sphaerosporella brunnea]
MVVVVMVVFLWMAGIWRRAEQQRSGNADAKERYTGTGLIVFVPCSHYFFAGHDGSLPAEVSFLNPACKGQSNPIAMKLWISIYIYIRHNDTQPDLINHRDKQNSNIPCVKNTKKRVKNLHTENPV